MTNVATGLQTGAKIAELFGGSRKKKVFLYLPSGSSVRAPASIPPVQSRPPSDGASTRMHLTSMAAAAGVRIPQDIHQESIIVLDDASESSDGSTEESSIDSSDDSPDNAINSADGDDRAEVSMNSDQEEEEEEPPQLYGYVTDDLSPVGVTIDDNECVSRTTETLRCSEALEEGVENTIPFLTHTFEEFIWQGTEDAKVMVTILIKLKNDQVENRKKLITILNNKINKDQCYFWIAQVHTEEAKKVALKYGIKEAKLTVLVLAPSHSRNMPQCVKMFDESNLQEGVFLKAINTAEEFCLAVKDERKKLEAWRLERKEQEEELQATKEENKQKEKEQKQKEQEEKEQEEREHEEKDQEEKEQEKKEQEENKIREARKQRVGMEQSQGVKIALRFNGGEKMARTFKQNAFFQEVYDWAGSMDKVPLHFTLQRGRKVVRHRESVQDNEVLDLYEREEQEVTLLLEDQVSFKGNYMQTENLSETVVDEWQPRLAESEMEDEKEENERAAKEEEKEENEGAAKEEEKEENEGAAKEEEKEENEGAAKEEEKEEEKKKKRKRNEKRSTKDRRMKKKEKNTN